MKALIISFSVLFCFQLQAQETITFNLFNLPDVVFTPIDTPEGYEAAFELRIKQPIDHKNPDKGHFYQRAYLSHRGYEKPMVLITEGYNRPRNRVYELTEYIDGNQIDIEHRFFGESMPEQIDYRYLTLEQVTADVHHINQIFKKLYTGKWLSTGISKGGQTTIYYRYLYPNDVDVSVPYVAPLNFELEDTRIYDWFKQAGTAECRADIERVQKTVLENRTEVLPLLKWYSKGAELEYNYLNLEKAFEYAVLEYPFSFFQWGSDCSKIPNENAPLEVVLEHLIDVSGTAFFSDRDIKYYGSHYYQAGTQMGYYSYDVSPFKGLIKALPTDKNPSAIFMPEGYKAELKGDLPKRTAKWLEKEGNNFIYIYGKNDTWSATAVPPSKKTNSLWIMMEGKHHGNARIKNMSPENKQAVEQTLEKWLDLDVNIR